MPKIWIRKDCIKQEKKQETKAEPKPVQPEKVEVKQ
jgi:hypothetical protein